MSRRWADRCRRPTEHTELSALPLTEPSAMPAVEPHTPATGSRYGAAGTRTISSDVPEPAGGRRNVGPRWRPAGPRRRWPSVRRVARGLPPPNRRTRTSRRGDDRELPAGAARVRGGRLSCLCSGRTSPPPAGPATAYISVVRIGDALLTTSSNGGDGHRQPRPRAAAGHRRGAAGCLPAVELLRSAAPGCADDQAVHHLVRGVGRGRLLDLDVDGEVAAGGGCSTASTYAIGLHRRTAGGSACRTGRSPVSGRLGAAGQDAATLRASSASGDTPSARPANTPGTSVVGSVHRATSGEAASAIPDRPGAPYGPRSQPDRRTCRAQSCGTRSRDRAVRGGDRDVPPGPQQPGRGAGAGQHEQRHQRGDQQLAAGAGTPAPDRTRRRRARRPAPRPRDSGPPAGSRARG